MSLPVVAIVGRPNVGKSTIFNRLAGERIAIVEDQPGITRDRIYSRTEWNGREFHLIDTGGIEFDEKDGILKHIRNQAELAIEEADVIIFVTEGRSRSNSKRSRSCVDVASVEKAWLWSPVNKIDMSNI